MPQSGECGRPDCGGNTAHLDKLKQGAKVWNAWRERHRDVTPELSGADLSGAGLAGIDFSKANLARANLTHAKLARADCSQADLVKATLSCAAVEQPSVLPELGPINDQTNRP